jgi:phage gp36-like protein
MARYLQKSDLDALVGSARVNQYFDDDNSGNLSEDELVELDSVMSAAESEVDSYLMRSFAPDAIDDLAENDPALKRHASWIALHFASERRTEFAGENGVGAYKDQYDRAITFCKNLSKGNSRSTGESVAGKSGRIGGVVQPRLQSGQSRFIFAKDKAHPTGHGGF